MNTQPDIHRTEPTDRCEERLEEILCACRADNFDNSRIKELVHARIAREKRARSFRNRLWGALSAAACVTAAVLAVVNLLSPGSIDLSEASYAEAVEAGYKELIVEPGRRVELTLSDGTRLVANSRTRVLYPEEFKGRERRIYSNGEVYLEVARDTRHPFIVESDDFEVRVLGTKFDVANTSDSTARVVLVEGSVELSTAEDRVRMRPNDMADLENGALASLSEVDASEYTLWVDGLLSLKGMPLSELTRRLNDYYGVVIDCDPAISNVKVYGKLDLHDSIESVMTAIGGIVPMDIQKDGNNIRLNPKS